MGQGPVSPSYIHKIFVSYAAETETTRWEKLMACSPYASRPQTGWSQKVDDADSHLLPQINQKNFHELIMFSLNHYYKTSHFPFQVGTHRLRPTAGFSLLHPKLSLWDLIQYQGREVGFGFSIMGAMESCSAETWSCLVCKDFVPWLQNGDRIGVQGSGRNGNREGVKLLHSTCQGRSWDQEAAADHGEANLRPWR